MRVPKKIDDDDSHLSVELSRDNLKAQAKGVYAIRSVVVISCCFIVFLALSVIVIRGGM